MKNLILAIIIILAVVSGLALVQRLGYGRLEVASTAKLPNGRIVLPTECAKLTGSRAKFSDGILTVRTECLMRNGVPLASEWQFDSGYDSETRQPFPIENVKAILFASSDKFAVGFTRVE